MPSRAKPRAALILSILLASQPLFAATALATDPTPQPSPSTTPERTPQPTGEAAGETVTAQSATQTVMPYGSSGYRYKVVAQGALPGFEAPSFDDVAAGFGNGTAAFADDTCGGPFATSWTGNTDILLRKLVSLPAGAQDVQVSVAIDNDIQVFWNGVDISGGLIRSEGCAFNDEYIFSVPASALGTTNLLAARGRERGLAQRIDLKVTAFVPVPATQLYGGCRWYHALCPVHFEAEPVNTAIGNYLGSATDLTLPGRGMGFSFQRSYNSLDAGSGVLGVGWRHAYEARLVINPDGSVRFFAEDGAQLLFASNGQGGFSAPRGVLSKLAPISGGYELTRRDQVRYRFDSTGLLTAMLDRNNNQLTFSYTAGQLTLITDTVGRFIDLSYDPQGRLAGLSGPLSLSVTYGYDGSGRLASVIDVRGKTTTYTYELGGRLATIVDPNNHTVVTNEYGPDGRVSAQTDARGKRGTFAWDPVTQTSTFTDARGGTWVDVYDGNVLQRSVDPLGNTTNYTYDTNLNLASLTDPRTFVTTFTYDAAGNLLTRTAPAPLSYVETWTYTVRNDVATYRDGRNNTTTYGYDTAGNLITITAPLSAVTTFGRDPAGTGLLFSATDPRGKTTTYGYDAQANGNLITTPLGNKTTMTYDPAGRMLTVVEPRGNVGGANPVDFTTTFTYDPAGHLLTATDPLGNLSTQTYDNVGNPLTIIDANQHTTAFAYDEANHLASVTDARNGITNYAYDDVSNLSSRTDAKLHLTTFGYDLAKRLTSTTAPLNRTWTIGYDPNGNATSRTDANQHTVTYVYDALNRLTAANYNDLLTPDASFGYDANSNRTSLVDAFGTETYVSDALNRLTSVTRGSDTFSYGYDPAGNLTSRTYPGQSAQTLVYDDDGRLTSANGATYTYDPAANLLTALTPDGFTARYTWDRAGRLLELAHTRSSGTLSRFTYALDGVGNPVAMTTRQVTVTYRYDELNRLTEACWSPTSCPGGPPAAPVSCLQCIGGLLTRPAPTVNPPPGETYRQYTYDPVGNRLTEMANAGTTTSAYDDADRLTTVTAPGGGVTTYTFDANGNQTGAGATTFTYDRADRLRSATIGATTETYAYSGDGTRRSASTGSQPNKTTKFIWDRNFALPQLALERNGSDALQRSYAYGLDLVSQKAGSKTYYYHHDGLGSVGDVTGSTGSSLIWNEYYPYGLVRQAGTGPGAPTNPFNFTGEQLDSTTGLYYLRARQYDPGTGRFLTTDPLASPTGHPYIGSYSYGRDNPCRYVDPSGLAAESPKSDWPRSLLPCDWVDFIGGLGLQALGSATVATSVVTEVGTIGLATPVDALFFGLGLVQISGGALMVRDAWEC